MIACFYNTLAYYIPTIVLKSNVVPPMRLLEYRAEPQITALKQAVPTDVSNGRTVHRAPQLSNDYKVSVLGQCPVFMQSAHCDLSSSRPHGPRNCATRVGAIHGSGCPRLKERKIQGSSCMQLNRQTYNLLNEEFGIQTTAAQLGLSRHLHNQ